MRERLNVRQTGILISLLLFVNKLLLLPSLLFKEAKADGFFIAIIMFLIELVFVYIFVKLKEKYRDKSLYQILQNTIGTILTKIIFIIAMFVIFLKIALLLNDSFVYLRDYVYTEATFFIFLVCIIPAITFLATSGLNALGRTCEFFYRYIIFGLLFCIFLGIFNIHSLPDFFLTNASHFFLGIYKNLFWYFDILCMYIIIDKVDYTEDLGKRVFKYVGINMLIVLALFFAFFSIYKVTAFLHGNAIIDVLMFSTNYGGIGRLDVIAILTMMFLIILQSGILLYCFSSLMNHTFNLTRKYCVGFFDVIFILIQYSFITNVEIIVNFSQGLMPYFIIFFVVIIPLLILIGLIKGGRHEKVSNKNKA